MDMTESEWKQLTLGARAFVDSYRGDNRPLMDLVHDWARLIESMIGGVDELQKPE